MLGTVPAAGAGLLKRCRSRPPASEASSMVRRNRPGCGRFIFSTSCRAGQKAKIPARMRAVLLVADRERRSGKVGAAGEIRPGRALR